MRIALAVWIGIMAAGIPPTAASGEAPVVVVSIRPLHSLAAGLMAGVGPPHLLIPGVGSPHHTTLRPSQARLLNNAQVVFWSGPVLEPYLVKPLKVLGTRVQAVSLERSPGVELLPARRGGMQGEDEPVHSGGGEVHSEGASDPHFWLDPRNARAVVRDMARVLSAADPPHAPAYARNAARLDKALAGLEDELRVRLSPLAGVSFVVFHDGYQYFEHRFGLRAAATVTVDPERPPGARRIAGMRRLVRDMLASQGRACVFGEAQFSSRSLRAITEDTGAATALLDPLGSTLEPGAALYFAMMRGLAAAFARCLAGS